MEHRCKRANSLVARSRCKRSRPEQPPPLYGRLACYPLLGVRVAQFWSLRGAASWRKAQARSQRRQMAAAVSTCSASRASNKQLASGARRTALLLGRLSRVWMALMAGQRDLAARPAAAAWKIRAGDRAIELGGKALAGQQVAARESAGRERPAPLLSPSSGCAANAATKATTAHHIARRRRSISAIRQRRRRRRRRCFSNERLRRAAIVEKQPLCLFSPT